MKLQPLLENRKRGSYLGQLFFGTAIFLAEEFLRIKISIYLFILFILYLQLTNLQSKKGNTVY